MAQIWKTLKTTDFFAPPDDPHKNLTETIQHCIDCLSKDWICVEFTYIVPASAFEEGKWKVSATMEVASFDGPNMTLVKCDVDFLHSLFLRETKHDCYARLNHALIRVFEKWKRKPKLKMSDGRGFRPYPMVWPTVTSNQDAALAPVLAAAGEGIKRDIAFMKRWSDDPQIKQIAAEWVQHVDLRNYDGPDDEDMAFDDYLEELRQGEE